MRKSKGDQSIAALTRRFIGAEDLEQKAKSLSPAERLAAFQRIVESGHIDTLVPLLPLLLSLEGQPFKLTEHFQFETLFKTRLPPLSVVMAARQCGKTQSITARAVAMAAAIPRLKQLFVTPLYEQARRLSNNYVRDLIENSPVRSMLISSKTEKSVLQRRFVNNSIMQFTFALLDVSRARGIASDVNILDEAQHINPEFGPILSESLSHSKWGLTQWTGTPLTPENGLNGLWRSSSMAEWFIPCHACDKWNIPSLEHHLDKMIGPAHADIGPHKPGLVCAFCSRPIDPADPESHWEHRFPDLRWEFPGYHIPQPIVHLHYSSPTKWAQLLAKREGFGNYTADKFTNEVLAEPCGSAAQLISEEELRRASVLPWPNDVRAPSEAVMSRLNEYRYRILGVDWGGGGKQKVGGIQDPVSLTTIALLGWTHSGKIDVLWGRRLYTPHDHLREAEEVKQYYRMFRCQLIAHDYTGSGEHRETHLIQNKVPIERVIPIMYSGQLGAVMVFKPATPERPRNHYIVNKSRSLNTTCSAIKRGQVRFFKFDFNGPNERGLIADFTALIEEKVSTRRAGDFYSVSKHAILSDDFAHAVNVGCCCLWHLNKAWPRLAEKPRQVLTAAQLSALDNNGQGFTTEDAV